MMKKLPYHLGEFEAITPPSVSPTERSSLPTFTPAKGIKQYTVAFFVGCIMDAMFRKINQLSVQLLAEVGCDVIVVENQTCCGALHVHAGESDQGKHLARLNIEAFEKIEADFIVNNAGGCGAMMVEYDHLLADEQEWAARAKQFVEKTRDISQVLIDCGGIPVKHQPKERVTYQRSCHMTHVQKVTKEPLELIHSISNVDFIEMKDPNMCCGSAGIYNIVNYEESMKILDVKMQNVKETRATLMVTTNPGCLLQMKLGIEREKLGKMMRAVHLVEYLAEVAGIAGIQEGN